ncbi:uncharacterized protein LOC123698447 [Colias croceus]|uniref:uncharacterized protein LOC123698447 n=1 Tax=Colias crocea TaxID=72248 RepID=UPI001E27A629|nr:uncharacterized protein LOC123698447 [Colias croceus]
MDSIQQSLDSMTTMFTTRMAEFENTLKGNKAAPACNANSLASEFSEFRNFVLSTLKHLHAQVNLLFKLYDHQETRSRKKILLIHGLPEENQEDTSELLVQFVRSNLKIPDFSTNNINRCHRIGRTGLDKPRPILVKLSDLSTKNKLWYGKTALKSTGITISEFLTKQRHEAFVAARKQFGINKCWTRDGFVIVLDSKGVKRQVTCLSDLNAIPQTNSEVESDLTSQASGGVKEAHVTQNARPKRCTKKQ